VLSILPSYHLGGMTGDDFSAISRGVQSLLLPRGYLSSPLLVCKSRYCGFFSSSLMIEADHFGGVFVRDGEGVLLRFDPPLGGIERVLRIRERSFPSEADNHTFPFPLSPLSVKVL